MKLKMLSLVLACMFLAGCTSAPADTDIKTENKPDTDITTETDETIEDTLFIGYDRLELYTWDTAPSYIVNKNGENVVCPAYGLYLLCHR